MLIQTLLSLFERDLNKLIAEINLYKKEENIWRTEKNISNSAGNLALHLIGNLNTYIGKEIGKTTYVRNRELEFSQKNIARQELIEKLNDTISVVKKSLATLTSEDLNSEYPILVFAEKTTTEYLLVHLSTHLAYHLGQVNYHRRLIEE
ncbi:DUF1572 domain-containing protein [Ferruginibacter lapsinanis]|uniref:DUF1572 family protein n=1 Tax=Ferruginibacter lapsinanis TaxID=563172 RepID=UPI001E3C713B|nr:DUF1572 family protein [Ferruginibacter lapsinanis]UEG49664.1 DUF1572 domain-containing protein [Ferruginibacter lapsinanis]